MQISLLTLLFEAITLAFRFGLGMQATRDTKWISRFTLGLRIHHGYWGLALIAISLVTKPQSDLLRNIGWALVLSDLIHHFLVLWPLTGSPEFHLTYPREVSNGDN